MRQSILLLLALALPTASAQQPFDLQAAIGHGLARQEFAQITLPEDAIIVLRRLLLWHFDRRLSGRRLASADMKA